jgi:hypothetical protein
MLHVSAIEGHPQALFLLMIPIHISINKIFVLHSLHHILVCGHLCNEQHVLINAALCYKFILFCECVDLMYLHVSLMCRSLVCAYTRPFVCSVFIFLCVLFLLIHGVSRIR